MLTPLIQKTKTGILSPLIPGKTGMVAINFFKPNIPPNICCPFLGARSPSLKDFTQPQFLCVTLVTCPPSFHSPFTDLVPDSHQLCSRANTAVFKTFLFAAEGCTFKVNGGYFCSGTEWHFSVLSFIHTFLSK
jgi:hypothetical protein